MIQKYSAEILNMHIRETVSFCFTYPFSELMGSITSVGDSRILLPDVTSCSDFRHALFDCYVDLLSTPLLVLSLHVVFSISAYSALLYSALARGMQTSERQY